MKCLVYVASVILVLLSYCVYDVNAPEQKSKYQYVRVHVGKDANFPQLSAMNNYFSYFRFGRHKQIKDVDPNPLLLRADKNYVYTPIPQKITYVGNLEGGNVTIVMKNVSLNDSGPYLIITKEDNKLAPRHHYIQLDVYKSGDKWNSSNETSGSTNKSEKAKNMSSNKTGGVLNTTTGPTTRSDKTEKATEKDDVLNTTTGTTRSDKTEKETGIADGVVVAIIIVAAAIVVTAVVACWRQWKRKNQQKKKEMRNNRDIELACAVYTINSEEDQTSSVESLVDICGGDASAEVINPDEYQTSQDKMLDYYGGNKLIGYANTL